MPETLAELRRRGKRVFFVSNNASKHRCVRARARVARVPAWRACPRARVRVSVYVCIMYSLRVYVCMYVCAHAHARAHACTCTHTRTHTSTHISTHTHKHTNTRCHTHTHNRSFAILVYYTCCHIIICICHIIIRHIICHIIIWWHRITTLFYYVLFTTHKYPLSHTHSQQVHLYGKIQETQD